jgi:transcriptional regulator with XRE-family HTH domain
MVNIAKLPTTDTPSGYVAAGVRAELSRRGWSGTQLATRLGVTQAAISRRLTGAVPFDVDMLARVSDALGVHPGFFFPSDDRDPFATTNRLTEAEQRVIAAMRSASGNDSLYARETQKAPTARSGGGEELLELDSNQQPIDFAPAADQHAFVTQIEPNRRAKKYGERIAEIAPRPVVELRRKVS